MVHLAQYARKLQARINVVAFLDDTHANSIPFRLMIHFLRRSRIFHAISDPAPIYLNQIDEFYNHALIHTEGEHRSIISTVFGHQIEITEDTISQVLQFGNTPDQPTQYEQVFIAGGLQRMGYPAIPLNQYRKQHLSRVWRFLCRFPSIGPNRIQYSTNVRNPKIEYINIKRLNQTRTKCIE